MKSQMRIKAEKIASLQGLTLVLVYYIANGYVNQGLCATIDEALDYMLE